MRAQSSSYHYLTPNLTLFFAKTLDGAVRADLKSVADSVLDKNYMGQLVAVQHRRGASGGTVFAKVRITWVSWCQCSTGGGPVAALYSPR